MDNKTNIIKDYLQSISLDIRDFEVLVKDNNFDNSDLMRFLNDLKIKLKELETMY